MSKLIIKIYSTGDPKAPYKFHTITNDYNSFDKLFDFRCRSVDAHVEIEITLRGSALDLLYP